MRNGLEFDSRAEKQISNFRKSSFLNIDCNKPTCSIPT